MNPDELIKKYRELPEELASAMASDETTQAIIGVGKKHALALDKIGILGDEIGSVMIGEKHPKDFIKNLAERLQVDPEKAKAIAQDVNVAIFKPIRESLKKVHGIQDEEMPKPPEGPPAMRVIPETRSLKLETENLKPKTPNQNKIQEVRPAPKVTPPLSAKPPSNLQSLTSKFSKVKEPAEKPYTYAPPSGGSFKASRNVLPSEMRVPKNINQVSDIKNLKPETQNLKPEKPELQASRFKIQENKPFWQRPMVENSKPEAHNLKLGTENKKTETDSKLQASSYKIQDKEPNIFAKPLEFKPEPEQKTEEKPQKPPASPKQEQGGQPGAESVKSELEKELNYKGGDPYHEPIE